MLTNRDPKMEKPNFAIRSDLVFIRLPCKFETNRDRATLEKGGNVLKGNDWALVRASNYVMVCSERVTVDEGDILWHIRDGVNIKGGYKNLDEPMSPVMAGLIGAAAATVAHQLNK